MKTCSTCHESKDESEFYVRQARCKACSKLARVRTCTCLECGSRFKAQRKASYCLTCSHLRAAKASKLVRDAKRPQREALKRASRISKTWLKAMSKVRICPGCGAQAKATWCSAGCYARSQRNPDQQRRYWIKPAMRARVFERDGYVCQLCHGLTLLVHDPLNDASPELDHIKPWSEGGRNSDDNLRVTHRGCNRDRNISR